MIDFLTTSELTSAIEKIIRNARRRIVIISPYIQISKNYINRLFDAEDRGVKISVIFGKSELDDRQNEILSNFKNLELFFCDNLHAKCYMNESTAIIGSMNLYEYSQNNNFEMGVLIQKDTEAKAFEEVQMEYELIKKSSNRMIKEEDDPFGDRRAAPFGGSSGYCIRCGNGIRLDPNYPLCRECFDVWNHYKDPNYQENVCHSCGKPGQQTMARPLCSSCFRSSSSF